MAGTDTDPTDRLTAAHRAYQSGDVVGALDLLPTVIAARPGDLSARLLLARCLVDTAEPAVAVAAAQAAVDCDRTSWQAQVLVARAARTVDPPMARRAAEAARHLAPDEPEVVAVQVALAEDEAGAAGERKGLAKPLAAGGRPAPSGGMPVDPRGGAPGAPGDVDDMAARVLARARAMEADDTETVGHAGAGDAPGDHGPGAPSPPGSPIPASPTTGDGSGPGPDLSAPSLGPTDRTVLAEPVSDEPDPKPLSRQPLLLAGMACWVFVGFRYGVQIVGGPIGIAGFLIVLVALGAYVRSRMSGTAQ